MRRSLVPALLALGGDEARSLAVARDAGAYVGGDYLKSEYHAALLKYRP